MVFPSFGVDMFFLSLRVCGSIEGPIWRTQIQSVNAREVEKNLWDFLGCLSIFFGIFWRIASLSVSLGQLWPNVSQSIWHVFPSNAIIYFRSRWNRHIPTVDGFLRSLREKPWSWTFDYKNISLLVMRHMTVRNTKVTYWHLGSQVYIYIRIYIYILYIYYIYIYIYENVTVCVYTMMRFSLVFHSESEPTKMKPEGIKHGKPGNPPRIMCRFRSLGKSPFLMGKSTINGSFSMAMLNYQRVNGVPFSDVWPGLVSSEN